MSNLGLCLILLMIDCFLPPVGHSHAPTRSVAGIHWKYSLRGPKSPLWLYYCPNHTALLGSENVLTLLLLSWVLSSRRTAAGFKITGEIILQA